MFIPYDDQKIQYIGRWAAYDNSMTATATGSRFSLIFQGKMAVLHFNTQCLQSPVPHLYIQVDDGALIESTLETYIRICAATDGSHKLTVILKSMVENFPRWNAPLTNRVSFRGIEADSLVAMPESCKKTIEFVGDSITEGVLIDADHMPPLGIEWLCRPFQDDVTATYAWQLAEQLDLIPLFMGYGAVGVTRGGNGGVPKAQEAYPFCFAGAAVSYAHPDYIFINHGSNDSGAAKEVYQTEYTALLDTILAAHPDAQVIAMSVFAGTHRDALEELIAAYNQQHHQHILFVDGSHWLPAEPLHPLRDGHRKAAEELAAVLRAELDL